MGFFNEIGRLKSVGEFDVIFLSPALSGVLNKSGT